MRFAPLRTVRGRLLLAALLIEMVMLAMLVGNSLRLLHEAMGEQAHEQADQIAPVLSAALVAPLAQFDYATVQAVLDESHAIRGIEYLAVSDATGTIVATSGWTPGRPLPPVDSAFRLDDDDDPPRYDVALPIRLAGQRLGTLQFGLDLNRILQARERLLVQGVLIAGGELLLSAGLLSLLGMLITRQLSVLTAASLRVAKGELTLAPVPEGQDDVGRLGAAFNRMSQAIAERVDQLTRARDETTRMATTLRERSAQLDAIFELSPDGFVSFDLDGRVTFASPAFFDMTGLLPADVVGHDERALSERLAAACIDGARFEGVPAMKARMVAEVVAQARHDEVTLPQRMLIELGGTPKRVLEVGLRVSAAEGVSQILFFRDVTHETEVDRMKSEFLSHAAHELRTPMASIYGFTEILRDRPVSEPKRQEMLGIIHRQSERMREIIDELLDLVRIDARRGQDLTLTELNLSDVVQEVVQDFGTPDGRQPAIVAGTGRAWWVRADAHKLQRALRNVLSNAFKYSPQGGDVQVDLLPSPAGGPARVGVRVRDHGLGMSPEQLARICERFYRADVSGNIPGTGLGMSIVKEIVELHGGELELSSQPGKGSRITIWLPALSGLSA